MVDMKNEIKYIVVAIFFTLMLIYFYLNLIPNKFYVSITFDDAYENQFLSAFPILKKVL